MTVGPMIRTLLCCLFLIPSFTRSVRADAFPDSLLARWESYQHRAHAPGVTVALVRDTGIVALATLGERDVVRHLPVTVDTRFYIASCTKPFVAAALWTLAVEGGFALDEPVKRSLPWFALATPGATDSLTVRDLLAHRRGLGSPAIGLLSAYTGQLTAERLRYWLARVMPRGRFAYNNLHYQIAGEVLAARTGQTWPRAVESRVTRPLGMRRAAFTSAQLGSDADVAVPYAWRHERYEPLEPKSDRTLHAAGGMGASIGDLARWLRAHLADGMLDGRRALPADVVRGMREVAIAAPDRHPLREGLMRVGWTAGWEVRTYEGDTIFVHTGSYQGAAAHFSYVPSRGVGVAVLADVNAPPLSELLAIEAYDYAAGRGSSDVSERLEQVMRRFSSDAESDTLPTTPVREAAEYAGRFTDPNWGDVVVAARGREVTMRLGEYDMPVHWRGADEFVADGDTPGSFERDARGHVAAVWLKMTATDSTRFAAGSRGHGAGTVTK